MFTSRSGPDISYGLHKIHKPNFDTNFQFRPIFAEHNFPSFNLAKFLVPLLNPFTCNEFTTANSHSFGNDITSVEDSSQFFMTSFDVENLFTNIPLNETINIYLNHLFTDPSSLVIFLSSKFFKTLLEPSVLYSFFTFNGIFLDRLMDYRYRAATWPDICKYLYVFLWINLAIRNCPVEFKPIFYRRYIADTFLLFRRYRIIQLCSLIT